MRVDRFVSFDYLAFLTIRGYTCFRQKAISYILAVAQISKRDLVLEDMAPFHLGIATTTGKPLIAK